MKRQARWLTTVKFRKANGRWVNADQSIKDTEIAYREFKKGTETTFNIHGSRITISGFGELPSNIVEGEHYEFINSN